MIFWHYILNPFYGIKLLFAVGYSFWDGHPPSQRNSFIWAFRRHLKEDDPQTKRVRDDVDNEILLFVTIAFITTLLIIGIVIVTPPENLLEGAYSPLFREVMSILGLAFMGAFSLNLEKWRVPHIKKYIIWEKVQQMVVNSIIAHIICLTFLYIFKEGFKWEEAYIFFSYLYLASFVLTPLLGLLWGFVKGLFDFITKGRFKSSTFRNPFTLFYDSLLRLIKKIVW